MLRYLIISLAWVALIRCNPIQPHHQRSSPLVYLTPSSTQYVPNNPYQFAQYQNEPAQPFGKALQSFQAPNDILFYPNSVPFAPQPVYVNTQPQGISSIPPVGRFTAPPSGLINAIYAWFAENNLAVPGDSTKNKIIPEKLEPARTQGKIDNPENHQQTSEADVLAEAEKTPHIPPKKPFSPKFSPGQRYYILNGQPQFFNNYQTVVPRHQPVAPQLFTRNSVPADPQNILILQPQHAHQQQPTINLKNLQSHEQSAQGLVLLRNNIGSEPIQSEYIKPVGYHGTSLKPQNYVLVRNNQPQNEPQQIQYQSTYPRQQVFIGRLLPQSHDIKQQQISQNPIHQTHYVPVEVVPPQLPIQTAQYQYDNQQDNLHQQLSFIHIPVDSNIQPPQYIKPLVQLPINAKSELPALPLNNHQQTISSPNPFLYLSPQIQQFDSINTPSSGLKLEQQELEQQQNIQQEQHNSGLEQQQGNDLAALEVARYIASRHGDLYSDTVVIDAKTDELKEQENAEDTLQADTPEEPSVAQAQPTGVALAGIGGIASTAPRGTALVNDRGLAIASPHATAVAGPENNKKQEKLT